MNKHVHIEHILPQNPTVGIREAFGEEDVEALIPMLGNLTLAESAINTSLGNKPYAQKKDAFVKSRFLLTQSIGQKVELGVNTAIDRAARGLRPFDIWNKSAIDERQALLARLARRVWDMPSPNR